MARHGSWNGSGSAPDTQPREKQTRCCARCATPYGHSAVAGTCCHQEPITRLEGTK